MVDEAPLVSVVIPCFAQAHYLGESVESVLAQTHPNVEIIVVDDGSPDDPADVVGNYPRVKLIRQANQGVSAARNVGLYASGGEYLVFLDADDRLLPEAISDGVASLEENRECGFFYGHIKLIDSSGSPLPSPDFRPVNKDFYLELLERNDIWSPGQVVYRRDILIKASGFHSYLSPAEDYDLNLRLARDFQVCRSNHVLFEYRVHDTNTSQNCARMLKATAKAYSAQWRNVKGRMQYVAAYKSGQTAALSDYGERLLDGFMRHVRKGYWLRAFQDGLTLLQYYPRGLANRVAGKIGKFFS